MRVEGKGFLGLGMRVESRGSSLKSSGLRVLFRDEGLGYRVEALGFRVEGLGLRTES